METTATRPARASSGLRRLMGMAEERATDGAAAPGPGAVPVGPRGLRRAMGFREGTTILLVLLIAAGMSVASPFFLTGENITTTVQSFSIDGFVVIAMTIVLISGGIDLSVASVMALAGVLTGVLFRSGLDIWLASAAGLGVGVVVGALNGFFITRLGLSPFITTLALQQIARGAAYVISGGVPVPLSNLPPQFKFMGRGTIGGTGIPFAIVLFLAVVAIFDFMSRRSTVVRKVYYVGSSEKAARLSGIDVSRVRMGVYLLSGLLAGIAGILTISRFNSATSYYGVGVDLKAISACVIGGASLNGGEGTILGSIIGITLMSVIASSLVLLDVSPYWQDLTMGLILLAAVSIDYLSHMRRK
ncbi:MAG TPA: ABC transporter permease [Anaeromyxobacteraceae bacterium]|nr:ABC transporter permease [Anaeromyxobacteraceae bacterium]